MDLSESIIMPREDYHELQSAADTSPTAAERAGNIAQTSLFFAAVAGAYVAGCWGYAAAHNWLEEKKLQRMIKHSEFYKNPQNSTN